MKKIFRNIFVLSAFALFLTACQEDPEPGGTATQEVAGEWYVKYYVQDGSGGLEEIFDYTKVMTFNTASNTPDSLWVSDVGNFWDYQVKTAYNRSDKTFSVSEAPNVSYESRVTVTDGKILLGQGSSTSGVKTDSIYFVVSFDDEEDADENITPYATQYIAAGHRRTGFLEDEH